MSIKEKVKKLIPCFLIDYYHYLLALTGAFLFSFPSRKLIVIGVTGTSGKTTVVDLTTRILEEGGHKVAVLSSIKFKIGEKEWENTLKMTMPGRLKIQKFMRQAVRAGCKYAVLEVTSEGIKQYRHKFIDFAVAVFTNLSPEHIEVHGGFENYRNAKLKLFKATKNIHIINIDDGNAEYFLDVPAKKKYTYGLNQGDINTKNTHFKLQLIGEFNIYNALAAVGVGLSQGISLETCKKALEKVKGMPGRMEIVIKKPFTVIVDYAITPLALEKVYKTLTKNYKLQTNNLICVLGACGGGRDKWKRLVLGKIAAKYCKEIIVTNEDPYDENPQEIIDQVAQGVENIRINQQNQHKSAVLKILDRREAIKKALELARSGDTVIITGKGCEPWMCVAGGKKIPWDDRQVVREEFEKEILRGVRYTFRGTKKYEILEHTADLKIRVFGKTKEELFLNSLLAMAESMKPEVEKGAEVRRKIKVKSADLPALLVDFLSEVLYLVQTNKEIYRDVKFKKFTDTKIEAELFGQKVERFGEDIKAVTYHNLEIKQSGNIWEATILFDI